MLMDIHCTWTGNAPSYRVYVNDELFSERTFIWRDRYLTELLQISAEPGIYQVRVEAVPHDPKKFALHNSKIEFNSSQFNVNNYQIEHGFAQWIDNGILEIKN